MTTVTVRKTAAKQQAATPSEQLVAKADSAVTIETPNGFTVTLRNPGVLSQFRLVKMVGGEAAKNTTYMQMIMPLLYVSMVNGNHAPLNSEREIEALITRLDEAGVTAVMAGVQEHFGTQADPEATKAEVKN